MDISSLPTAVDVTLYRYNHLDNRLWVQIKNELDYIEVDENSVIVSTGQIVDLLNNHYMSMINRVKSTGAEMLHAKVNAPYFIYTMCVDLHKLQLIKFTRSYDKSFSRLLEIDGNKVLKFDFKVLSATYNLANFFEQEELDIINPILEDLEILEEEVPYNRIKMIDLLDKLDFWVSGEMDNEIPEGEKDPIPLITAIMDMIEVKIERDNPTVLLITDY